MKKLVLKSLIAFSLLSSLFTCKVFASENFIWDKVKDYMDKKEPYNILYNMEIKGKSSILYEPKKIKKNKVVKKVLKEEKLNNSNNIDELYSNAYNSTILCLKEKSQKSINNARTNIKFLPKEFSWATNEFSRQIDTVQQKIFEHIIKEINIGRKNYSQKNINNARELLIDIEEPQYKQTWSSELDKIQQKKIDFIINNINNSKITNNVLYLNSIKSQLDDLAIVEYNPCVKEFLNQLVNNINQLNQLNTTYRNTIINKLNGINLNKINTIKNKIELRNYLYENNFTQIQKENICRYWISLNFKTSFSLLDKPNEKFDLDKRIKINSQDELYYVINYCLENFVEHISLEITSKDIDSSLDEVTDLRTKVSYRNFGKPDIIYNSEEKDLNSKFLNLNFQYPKDIEILKKQKSISLIKAQSIINDIIKPNMNDFQKEKTIYNYIVKNTKYNKSSEYNLDEHNLYGVLIYNKGVCEGYAKVFNLMLDLVNIENKYVMGYGVENGKILGSHAWNMVKINNNWYNTDITWEDSKINSYKYMNLSDNEFFKTHKIYEYKFLSFPICLNSYELSY